ncbi:unnamed protein product [Cuscuta campestris]|uniref:Uncharacterized protein n=1 Tax=Cuscuta campestris TaxID=132261 RepID=A0A484KQX9_9ASTE|nr:unnamed protein product [Cuscuta campestris]
MGRIRNRAKLLMMILSFALLLLFCPPAATGGEDGASAAVVEAARERRHPVVEAAMALFSLPTAFPRAPSYWLKLSSFFKQGMGFFFTAPDLDFRGNGGVPKGAEEEGTAGEKVKEAVVKSKAAMEDSAKSAAKLAGEVVDMAAKNLKMTLSRTSSQQDDDDDDEL